LHSPGCTSSCIRSSGLPNTCLKKRRAIDAAFGVSERLEPEPFRVALAAFQLVCDLAEAGPVVLIVDDAQWIDQSSMRALTFIARRLDSEPVALVAAIRSGRRTLLDDAHLPTLDVERLSVSASATLLDQRAPELHPISRVRILSEASGNPLQSSRSSSTCPLRLWRLRGPGTLGPCSTRST